MSALRVWLSNRLLKWAYDVLPDGPCKRELDDHLQTYWFWAFVQKGDAEGGRA